MPRTILDQLLDACVELTEHYDRVENQLSAGEALAKSFVERAQERAVQEDRQVQQILDEHSPDIEPATEEKLKLARARIEPLLERILEEGPKNDHDRDASPER